jgi:hypothetical protein
MSSWIALVCPFICLSLRPSICYIVLCSQLVFYLLSLTELVHICYDMNMHTLLLLLSNRWVPWEFWPLFQLLKCYIPYVHPTCLCRQLHVVVYFLTELVSVSSCTISIQISIQMISVQEITLGPFSNFLIATFYTPFSILV